MTNNYILFAVFRNSKQIGLYCLWCLSRWYIFGTCWSSWMSSLCCRNILWKWRFGNMRLMSRGNISKFRKTNRMHRMPKQLICYWRRKRSVYVLSWGKLYIRPGKYWMHWYLIFILLNVRHEFLKVSVFQKLSRIFFSFICKKF